VKRALDLALSGLIGLASVLPASLLAPPATTVPAQQQSKPLFARADRRDLLPVIAKENANADHTEQELDEAHNTVISRLGFGTETTLIIKAEHGKATEVIRLHRG